MMKYPLPRTASGIRDVEGSGERLATVDDGPRRLVEPDATNETVETVEVNDIESRWLLLVEMDVQVRVICINLALCECSEYDGCWSGQVGSWFCREVDANDVLKASPVRLQVVFGGRVTPVVFPIMKSMILVRMYG